MPRPAARPVPPRPASELPRWVVVVAAGAVVIAAAAALLWRINSTNQHLQAEQRLAGDPVLGPWLADMRHEIAALERRGTTGPPPEPRQAEAVWLGRVRSLEFSNKPGEGPRLSDVTLTPAHLVAGRRGPKDPRGDAGVRISVQGFQWPRGEPREGESWVFSVYRINQGFNRAQAAYPAP